MPTFRFELEPLLTARRQTEKSRQRAVAVIEQERQHIEVSLRAHQQQIHDSKHSMRSGLIGVVDAEQLRWLAAATMLQMREAQRLVLQLAGVHRRLEQARNELIEASRQRRAVELLRERRFEEWKAAQEKIETDAIDELAVMAAARGNDQAIAATSFADIPI